MHFHSAQMTIFKKPRNNSRIRPAAQLRSCSIEIPSCAFWREIDIAKSLAKYSSKSPEIYRSIPTLGILEPMTYLMARRFTGDANAGREPPRDYSCTEIMNLVYVHQSVAHVILHRFSPHLHLHLTIHQMQYFHGLPSRSTAPSAQDQGVWAILSLSLPLMDKI